MDDNNLLMIILAFVFGFMLQGMMKNMCGGRLIEGAVLGGDGGVGDSCWLSTHCNIGLYCKGGDPSTCEVDNQAGFQGFHPGLKFWEPGQHNSTDYLEYITRF